MKSWISLLEDHSMIFNCCKLEDNFDISYFLFQLEVIHNEVKQILPQGIRKHRRTDSNGSSVSSRSNPLREEKLGRSNTQRARSQLLETHLAKLFKQKVEIFTKIEYTQVLSGIILVIWIWTYSWFKYKQLVASHHIIFADKLQESVVTTIVKFCLKSVQEFVRLQTFNRSGFQQIQLDIQFLRTPIREIVEDEAAVDFLLDEVRRNSVSVVLIFQIDVIVLLIFLLQPHP